MSHRVQPKIFRIKGIDDWYSKGFYGSAPAKYLEEDFRIREFLEKELKLAEIERIDIERSTSGVNVIVHSARPGIIIGRRGEKVSVLKSKLESFLSVKKGLKIDELFR